eukprot:8511018-Lingulodinium_polyedra.AAC.1
MQAAPKQHPSSARAVFNQFPSMCQAVAPSRVPRARQFSGVRVERASVRCPIRCGGGRSTRPHHCA